jgi:A/G-specific adenine glycosylase
MQTAPTARALAAFKKTIYDYYREHGRVLTWRKTTDPYKILVSEIMLQQTQVDRVVPKYKAFIKAFPTAKKLASASVAEVLALWSGLGYNRRALFLKKAAEEVIRHYGGRFPQDYTKLLDLPGIGTYTASAVRAFAFNEPSAFIETNIRSVFLHFFFKDQIDVHDSAIFPLIEKTVDRANPREWYWALMDYGTMLKREFGNASRASKHYTKQSKFQGSDRQVRGEILKFLLAEKQPLTQAAILKGVARPNRPKDKILAKIAELSTEGFIQKQKNKFVIQ